MEIFIYFLPKIPRVVVKILPYLNVICLIVYICVAHISIVSLPCMTTIKVKVGTLLLLSLFCIYMLSVGTNIIVVKKINENVPQPKYLHT